MKTIVFGSVFLVAGSVFAIPEGARFVTPDPVDSIIQQEQAAKNLGLDTLSTIKPIAFKVILKSTHASGTQRDESYYWPNAQLILKRQATIVDPSMGITTFQGTKRDIGAFFLANWTEATIPMEPARGYGVPWTLPYRVGMLLQQANLKAIADPSDLELAICVNYGRTLISNPKRVACTTKTLKSIFESLSQNPSIALTLRQPSTGESAELDITKF